MLSCISLWMMSFACWCFALWWCFVVLHVLWFICICCSRSKHISSSCNRYKVEPSAWQIILCDCSSTLMTVLVHAVTIRFSCWRTTVVDIVFILDVCLCFCFFNIYYVFKIQSFTILNVFCNQFWTCLSRMLFKICINKLITVIFHSVYKGHTHVDTMYILSKHQLQSTTWQLASTFLLDEILRVL